MIKYLLLLLLVGNSAQAYRYFPYSFTELETELFNLSGGTISAKPDLPAEARNTAFRKVGVTFHTGENPSELNPQDYFTIDVAKFNSLMNAPDFLTAKREFYSRLHWDKRHQRYYRPYSYLESWRSLFHPQIKSLNVAHTVIDRDMTPIPDGERAAKNSPYFNPALQREVDVLSNSELTIGNQLDLLQNVDAFEHKLDMIRRAKKSFFGIVMVLACDRQGSRFVDELIKAKERGVDVKMMHEGVWSKITNAGCVKRMKRHGIDVLLPSDMISNHFALGVVHNKFYIRDGEEAIIGGQNLVDAETESDGFNAKMKDTDVWIHAGPEVTTLLYQYANLWHRYAKKDQRERIVPYLAQANERLVQERSQGVRGSQYYEKWLSDPSIRMNGVCRSVVQKYGKEDQIGPVLQRYAQEATSRILATTPNVQYHDNRKKPVINNLLNTLTERANQGVTVDVISNGIDGTGGAVGDWFRDAIAKARSKVSTMWQVPILKALYQTAGIVAAKGDGKELARLQNSSPNIRAWTYTSFIHSKQMVMDRTMVAVGSFNLEHHSSSTNHEAEIFCLDERLANQIEHEFVMDLANSVPFPRR